MSKLGRDAGMWAKLGVALVAGAGAALAAMVLALHACGGSELGAACHDRSDCGAAMICRTEGPLRGQCTSPCKTSNTCRRRYGRWSFCIGDGDCVRQCGKDSECPEHVGCDRDHGWCKRFDK